MRFLIVLFAFFPLITQAAEICFSNKDELAAAVAKDSKFPVKELPLYMGQIVEGSFYEGVASSVELSSDGKIRVYLNAGKHLTIPVEQGNVAICIDGKKIVMKFTDGVEQKMTILNDPDKIELYVDKAFAPNVVMRKIKKTEFDQIHTEIINKRKANGLPAGRPASTGGSGS